MTVTQPPPDLARLAMLDGLITPAVGNLLYERAARVPAGQAIVELGSYKGQSTAFLAAGARAGNRPPVFAVDPWDKQPPPGTNGRDYYRFADPYTRAVFDRQLTAVGLRSQVTALQGFSVDEAAIYDGPPVGLLYVDGDHTRDAVVADVKAWLPHLDPACTIVFDDYLWTETNHGVGEAVEHLRASRVLDPAIGVVARCAVATLAASS